MVVGYGTRDQGLDVLIYHEPSWQPFLSMTSRKDLSCISISVSSSRVSRSMQSSIHKQVAGARLVVAGEK